jgi:hypothetical protein
VSGVQELSGTILKGYHLDDCLGWTSHTAVYRARRNGASWAVKVFDGHLEPGSSLAERLRREAEMLASMDLPHVVPVQDAGRSGKLTFAVSPLVRAHTLRDLMGRGRVDNEQAWSVLTGLANALDSLHRRGLVYRALRPDHVLVDADGIHLAEFGVASGRVGPLMLSSSSYHAAAPQYLAPEQVEGMDPDWRADVYSLAVLVFELLTGTSLQGSRTPAEVLSATLAGPPPSAHEREPALPPAVDQVLARAMALDPDDRHRSAGELLHDLVTLPEDGMAYAAATQPQAVPAGPGPPALPEPAVSSVPALLAPAELAPGGVPKGPIPSDSMVAVLKRMGVPVFRGRHDVMLNAYFAALVHHAREACRERWPEVAAAAGLQAYLVDQPPDDVNSRSAPVIAASQLADAIEAVFGPGAPEVLRLWGRQTTDFWIRKMQQIQEGEVTYMKPFRLRSTAQQKVEDALYVFTRNLDRIRGERLTTWKKVEKRQFWVVHYDNLTAVGGRRPARACNFSTAALQQALRWGGCANDWFVEEAECGCVTGTYDCVFTIQRVQG